MGIRTFRFFLFSNRRQKEWSENDYCTLLCFAQIQLHKGCVRSYAQFFHRFGILLDVKGVDRTTFIRTYCESALKHGNNISNSNSNNNTNKNDAQCTMHTEPKMLSNENVLCGLSDRYSDHFIHLMNINFKKILILTWFTS